MRKRDRGEERWRLTFPGRCDILEARSRREQRGWTGARASGGAHGAPQTSPKTGAQAKPSEAGSAGKGRARKRREACPKGGKSGADFATTERDKVYLYLVRHPELGETEALAENRLRAVCAAAKIWGVPWTSIATACKCERVEKRE